MSIALGLLPSVRAYAVALPAFHWKVTVEEVKVDPGAGLIITAGLDPGVVVGVGLGVGLGVDEGVGVGVGVGVGGGGGLITSKTRTAVGVMTAI